MSYKKRHPSPRQRPAASRVKVARAGGLLRITCPSSTEPIWPVLAFCCGLVWPFSGFVLVGGLLGLWQGWMRVGGASFLLLLGLLLVAFTLPMLATAIKSRVPLRLTVAGSRLVLSRPWGTRHHEWDLDQATKVRVVPCCGMSSCEWHNDLRIISAEGEVTVLSNRTEEELSWIAGMLQQAAATPTRQLPPQAAELEVTFARDAKLALQRGYLRVRPGELAVRCDFSETYHYEFFAVAAWTAALWWRRCRGLLEIERRTCPLQPGDVNCRIDRAGTAHLQIDRAAWPQVTLFLFCDDKAGLEAALARFWGAAE